jgi:hypothetical protein
MSRDKVFAAMRLCSIVFATALISFSVQAQAPSKASAASQRLGVSARHALTWPLPPDAPAEIAQELAPSATPPVPVLGSGTLGRLPKWTRFTGIFSLIGDSTIFEDSSGKVGIGTDSPTSSLTVAGMIETRLGGYKFPDGTIQNTAAASGLRFVSHDTTLHGDGSGALPLGVAVPLFLSGSASEGNGALEVQNLSSGEGIQATGGPGNGVSFITQGGTGVVGSGGLGQHLAAGGTGVMGVGGRSLDTSGDSSGAGVVGIGGDNNQTTSFFNQGGIGVTAQGGSVSGTDNSGGVGMLALGGTGFGGANQGRAAIFAGDVDLRGNLNVSGTKNFRIDHPLYPEDKYLVHAAIESSEALNVYSGNTVTDTNGDAVITLPEWFEAVNRDLRYQLTVLGTFAQAIIAEKVKQNRFTIKTNAPNVEVSWQVTGVRSDPSMLEHPFQSVEDKNGRERGYYVDPKAYNQPEQRGIDWARNPMLMRQMRAAHDNRNAARLTSRTGNE